MNDKVLESLLRQVVEVEDLFGGSGVGVYRTPGRRAALLARRFRWIVSAAAAAALTLAMTLPQRAPRRPPPVAEPVVVDICRETGRTHPDSRRIDTFHPCADRDGYALVLFRAWSEDCACLKWELHEFEDGRRVVQFAAGEELSIPLDVTDDPPLEQVLLFAVSTRAGDLPADDEAAEELLACLNEELPPGCCAEAAEASSSALASCLPVGVTVVPEPFYVE